MRGIWETQTEPLMQRRTSSELVFKTALWEHDL